MTRHQLTLERVGVQLAARGPQQADRDGRRVVLDQLGEPLGVQGPQDAEVVRLDRLEVAGQLDRRQRPLPPVDAQRVQRVGRFELDDLGDGLLGAVQQRRADPQLQAQLERTQGDARGAVAGQPRRAQQRLEGLVIAPRGPRGGDGTLAERLALRVAGQSQPNQPKRAGSVAGGVGLFEDHLGQGGGAGGVVLRCGLEGVGQRGQVEVAALGGLQDGQFERIEVALPGGFKQVGCRAHGGISVSRGMRRDKCGGAPGRAAWARSLALGAPVYPSLALRAPIEPSLALGAAAGPVRAGCRR